MVYDSNGNEIEENGYKSNGDLAWKYIWKYTYDKHGNWIEKITFIQKEETSTVSHTKLKSEQ